MLASHWLVTKTRLSAETGLTLMRPGICFLLESPLVYQLNIMVMRTMQLWCHRQLLCRHVWLMRNWTQVGIRMPLCHRISSNRPAPVRWRFLKLTWLI